MQLYSTNNKALRVSLKEAVFKGLPEDNGLFMPVHIPLVPDEFIQNLPAYSFEDISYTVAKILFGDYIPESDLRNIIDSALTFPAPLVQLAKNKYVLELFHGPSLAFKDFGARFMAKLMGYFNRSEDQDLVILVATSGDTGGAVASGFYNTPGIKVVILYPSGKVSDLQEKQLTTLGGNITALEVNGNFDDCQSLVKRAFLDQGLRSNIRLSSANSINIARLIPQSFYYFEAYKQLISENKVDQKIVFSVPSGNFGNLTAGLFAYKMGLPIDHFIAATNINDIVPCYLESGSFDPRASVQTISNAMDVGNPSNFVRMIDLFPESDECSTWNNIKKMVSGFRFDDDHTRAAIKETFLKYSYIIDPHGGVGLMALDSFLENDENAVGVVLETAHPSKFLDVVEKELSQKVDIPDRLASLRNNEKVAIQLDTSYPEFRSWLSENY